MAHNHNPFGGGQFPGGVPVPAIPEQTGEVDLDEKTREVLLGLGNKVERHMKENLLATGGQIPDFNALLGESIGMLNSMDRFIRANGQYHADGVDWADLVKQIEPLYVKLQNWQGIFQSTATAMEIGRLLLASLHADIIAAKELTKEDGTAMIKLAPDALIAMFRLNYESKNLESMRGAFPEQPQIPQQPQGPGQEVGGDAGIRFTSLKE